MGWLSRASSSLNWESRSSKSLQRIGQIKIRSMLSCSNLLVSKGGKVLFNCTQCIHSRFLLCDYEESSASMSRKNTLATKKLTFFLITGCSSSIVAKWVTHLRVFSIAKCCLQPIFLAKSVFNCGCSDS